MRKCYYFANQIVKDFPKELVLLSKYRNVGETALANLFNQLKLKGMEFTKVEV